MTDDAAVLHTRNAASALAKEELLLCTYICMYACKYVCMYTFILISQQQQHVVVGEDLDSPIVLEGASQSQMSQKSRQKNISSTTCIFEYIHTYIYILRLNNNSDEESEGSYQVVAQVDEEKQEMKVGLHYFLH